MLKNSDCIYTMGHSHRTCDDFAYSLNLNDDFNISIVADGCSSSKNSDIGTRLICSKILQMCHIGWVINPELIMGEIDNCFQIIFNQYHDIYGDLFLDCTLLLAVTYKETTVVIKTGDGSILYRTGDGSSLYRIREFENNAPAYLSYNLDEKRKENYLKFSTNYTDKTIVSDIGNSSTHMTNTPVHMTNIPVEKYVFNQDNKIKYLMLFTDGLSSFTDTTKDFSYYAEKMMDIKNEKGVFFQRQVLGVCKLEEKEENFHSDDLSGIALIFE